MNYTPPSGSDAANCRKVTKFYKVFTFHYITICKVCSILPYLVNIEINSYLRSSRRIGRYSRTLPHSVISGQRGSAEGSLCSDMLADGGDFPSRSLSRPCAYSCRRAHPKRRPRARSFVKRSSRRPPRTAFPPVFWPVFYGLKAVSTSWRSAPLGPWGSRSSCRGLRFGADSPIRGIRSWRLPRPLISSPI